MALKSIRYEFSQHFDVPAGEAYKWCTDYDPNDLPLMGEKGTRKIEWISKGAVILRDSVKKDRKTITKTKLVHLDPLTLTWTNTHVSGPYKYSQFLYRIVPEGKSSSRLEFTGLQLMDVDDNRNARKIASAIRKEDSGAWKLLAKALEKDLKDVSV